MRARTIVGLVVLAGWLAVVAMHVRREYFKGADVVLAEGAEALAPGTFFYVVEMDGRAIGVASSRLDTLPTDSASRFVFEDVLRLDVPALNTLHRAVVRTSARLGPALNLREFQFRLESEIGDFDVRGVAREDSLLDLRLDAGGEDQTSTMRLDRSITLPVALPLRMAAAGRLDVGDEYSARVFDPSSMSERTVEMRVTGRDMMVVTDSSIFSEPRQSWLPAGTDTVPVWIVEESYGGISVRSWLDNDGRLVRAESPMGFTIRRTDYDLANQAWERSRKDPGMAAGYGAVIENTAIAADVDLTVLRTIDSLAVRLRNVELEGFDLDGGRQALRGDTLHVRREAPSALAASYSLPYRGDAVPAETLEPTPLIQSEHPRIRARALEVAGGSTDPAEVARRLNDWVYDTLAKDITLSIPSALQVLETERGDCNEHTVLYVALARSLGLPARTAVGLVHVRGRFYYHAWPEVWLNEAWVAVDPTLDQFPADASHLRFLIGGLARQVELIRLIGRLDLDILEDGA